MAIVLTKSNVVDEMLSVNAEKRRPEVGSLCRSSHCHCSVSCTVLYRGPGLIIASMRVRYRYTANDRAT